MSHDHPQHVATWLGEVFGGPPRYTDEHGGYPHMLAKHRGRALTEPQRRRWVELICDAADEAGLPADPEFRSAFVAYIEWGTRLALANSQPGADAAARGAGAALGLGRGAAVRPVGSRADGDRRSSPARARYALPGFEGEPEPVRDAAGARRVVSRGTFAGVEVAHVSRHGAGHVRLSNHVTHRANIGALAQLGVDAVLAVTVCGAVDPGVELGSLICFDDLHFPVNRLPDGSLCTFYAEAGDPRRGHWIYEDPFAPALRAALLVGAAARAACAMRDGGCYGHVDGPRFNTRAEIRGLAAAGVTAVSQTAGPETVLAGEAELPFALVGYATDYANGVQAEATPVARLLELIAASTDAFARVLADGAAADRRGRARADRRRVPVPRRVTPRGRARRRGARHRPRARARADALRRASRRCWRAERRAALQALLIRRAAAWAAAAAPGAAFVAVAPGRGGRRGRGAAARRA